MLYLLLIILLSNVDRCFLQSDLSTFNSLDQSADQIQGEDEVADLNEQRQRHEGWLISNLLNVLNTTIATGPMPKLELFRFQCISAEQIFGESPNSIFSQGNLHAEFEIRPENGPNEKFILEFKSPDHPDIPEGSHMRGYFNISGVGRSINATLWTQLEPPANTELAAEQNAAVADSNYGITMKATLDSLNKSRHVFVEIRFKADRPARSVKKNLNTEICDPLHPSNGTCCRYQLLIDFERLEWNWIISPKQYQAYFCIGHCPAKNRPTSLGERVGCVPHHMSPLRITYVNEEGEFAEAVVPNMVVESCRCV